MKTLPALLFIIPLNVYAYGPYEAEVLRVLDGDTVEVRLHVLPGLTKTTKLRLLGINAPETTWRAKCDEEKALGMVAKNRFIELLEPRVRVNNIKEGKYAGRLLGDIESRTLDIGETLIQEGLARPYLGRKKSNWCD